jgi:hypothetical protein
MLRRACLILVLAACEPKGGTTAPDDTNASDDGATPLPEDDDGAAEDGEEPPAPKVEQVQKIDGALKKAEVDEVLEKYFREIRECFDAGLARNPNEEIDGAIVVEIKVAAGGNVELAQGELNETGDGETEACIVAEVGKWTFPKKKSGSTILHPFYLRSY